MIEIRDAQKDDLPAISIIVGWAARETAANFFSDARPPAEWESEWRSGQGEYPWLVATFSGAVVGFTKAEAFQARCAYRYTVETAVYIDPTHHGRGVGTKLYGVLLDRLQALEFHSAVAVITTPNPASERLHARFGFERFGLLRRAGWKFGRWHDVSYWQRFFRDSDHRPGGA